MEAAGITSFTLAADLKSGGRRRAPACPLPPADTTASSLTVPYAGGWLKGVDFGCRCCRPCPAVPDDAPATPTSSPCRPALEFWNVFVKRANRQDALVGSWWNGHGF